MRKISHTESESGRVLTIVLIVILLIAGISAFWIVRNIYAKPFDPVVLSQPEKKVLDDKISLLEKSANTSRYQQASAGSVSFPDGRLKPEPYSEKDAKREITLTERELNSLISDPEIARNVAIDLSDNLLSVKILVPMDEEFPILGGKTIKLHFGTTLAYSDNNLVVAMRGISIGGVPLPSAWWGGIKNENLVEYFGGNGGFWDTLAAGISDVKITDGQMYVKLKE